MYCSTITGLFVIMFLIGTVTVPAAAPARTISVSGVGAATAPPDMAAIETGVVTQSETAGKALQANTAAMNEIMSTLKSKQIADKDIQTTSFDIQPEYNQQPRGGREESKIIGYRVTNRVRIRVRNLPQLGEVLDAVVSAGSNQISGIQFGIDNVEGVINQARNRAVADARSRAELYAQAAGVAVGNVISISEQSRDMPRPQPMARMMAMESASAVPVATGEQEVQASVDLVFALEDRK